ncbi:uncharacterized protein LOC135531233 [Oncorhynchus masou masou]|uniref:uncharacterized protein LOC135531233 n=1 Tax=Oncorhynchus masou masou TaxID=90313 RepID=UPI0031830B95
MTEYYEERGCCTKHSPPMHIKVESPEGPARRGVSEDGFPREDEDSGRQLESFLVLLGGSERRERERIWAGILERVNAVSRVPRTLREVKKRWDDLKRRNGGRLADARHRTCYLPSNRGASMLGLSAQASPRLHQARQKQSSRGKASFTCFTDTEPVGGGEGLERDGFEKDEDSGEREVEVGEAECEGAESSMEEKLGFGLGLGIGPPLTRNAGCLPLPSTAPLSSMGPLSLVPSHH